MLAPAPTPSATAPEKRRRWSLPSLGFSLRLNLWYTGFFVLGSLVLFALAYLLLMREITLSVQDQVITKMIAYRAAYAQGGIYGLQEYIEGETYWEKESTFVEVIAAKERFIHFPRTKKEITVLSNYAKPGLASNSAWINFASAEQNMGWTVWKSRLPDGALIFVGRISENREHLLRQFRIFLFAIIPIVALGFCGGAFLTYRALETDSRHHRGGAGHHPHGRYACARGAAAHRR